MLKDLQKLKQLTNKKVILKEKTSLSDSTEEEEMFETIGSIEGYPENGDYSVSYNYEGSNKKDEHFKKLSDAKTFFDSLHVAKKAIWDNINYETVIETSKIESDPYNSKDGFIREYEPDDEAND